MNTLMQIIYLSLGTFCFLTLLIARGVVRSAMASMEYDNISHAFTWILLSPIAVLGLYFWWAAISL